MFEKIFLIPFIITFLITTALTPLVIKFAWKFNFLDDPKKEKHPKKIHTMPIPRAGGLAIALAIVMASLIFLNLDRHLFAILLSVFILTILGLADDKLDLNPYFRLIILVIAALIPIASGIGIAYISNPLTNSIIDLSHPQLTFNFLGEARTIWILSDLFALLWLVSLMMFLNMGAKGVEGQLPGVAGIAAIVIGILSIRFSADITEWPVTILAAITAGSLFGFLQFNAHPQKIMPGFSGSTVAGFLLGILSILTTTKVGMLMVVLAVPMIDTGYAIVRRVLAGKSPVWGDRGHLHHKLLDLGFSTKQVAWIYWAVTGLLGITALFLESEFKLYTIIGLTFFIGGLFILLTKKNK